jgi:hypothetical protein
MMRYEMSNGRTSLIKGRRVLTEHGTAIVVSVLSSGVKLRSSFGDIELIGWTQLAMVREIHDGEVVPMIGPLRPLWDALEDKARKIALDRLEIVQEIMTGYRDGHPELRREGEPRPPFGPGFGVSESARCEPWRNFLPCKGSTTVTFSAASAAAKSGPPRTTPVPSETGFAHGRTAGWAP